MPEWSMLNEEMEGYLQRSITEGFVWMGAGTQERWEVMGLLWRTNANISVIYQIS